MSGVCTWVFGVERGYRQLPGSILFYASGTGGVRTSFSWELLSLRQSGWGRYIFGTLNV